MPIIENEHLLVEIEHGAFARIVNKKHDLNLIQANTRDAPWQIETPDQQWHSRFRHLSCTRETSSLITSTWRGDGGFEVSMRVQLEPGDRAARVTLGIAAPSDVAIDKVECPIIRGIGDFGYGDRTRLAHAQGTGFLFRNPLHLFTDEKPGLRYSPYPEGFSGSSLQLMAYYVEDLGGFSFSVNDSGGAMKWLNFWKEGDSLNASFMHQAPDVKPGNDLVLPYAMQIGVLDEGTWYEAAEQYKVWAVQQPWVSKGPLHTRPNWLHTETGFATFGINASHDRSSWLDHFHRITGKPVFHVLGVNWPTLGGNYGGVHPGSRDDWFPARFDSGNMSTIDANGDFWAPFEFDLLQNPDGADKESIGTSLVTFQEQKYSFDAYRFPFHCPVTPYQRELHAWRDASLAGEYGADALYYDISANNVTMQCRSPHHGHPVGGGGWMVDAYRSMWENTGRQASTAKGQHVPQGAEMVNEVFLDRLDFYQARAEAAPLSPFESNFFRDWIISGQCEKIPLFAFVYHEYGPIRLDGWGKLSKETGELWYWVAARVALWGGMYELNYEFSPLEVLDGKMEDTTEHYATIAPVEYAIDPAKEDFVRDIALARTGFAQPYLVFGIMQRPLDLDVPDIDLNWRMYNFNPHSDIYDQQGIQRVPMVQHSAWLAPDGSLGLLFVNLHATDVYTLPLAWSLRDYGLDWHDAQVEIVTQSGTTTPRTGIVAGNITLDLLLPPRRMVLVKISALEGDS